MQEIRDLIKVSNNWITEKQLESVPIDAVELSFYLVDCFWECGKYCKYYEHKFDAYKNNKKKIFTYNKGFIFMEEPYKMVEKNGTSFGFTTGKPKEVDEETLNKYFKEITRNTYFEKQITHIPTT